MTKNYENIINTIKTGEDSLVNGYDPGRKHQFSEWILSEERDRKKTSKLMIIFFTVLDECFITPNCK